LLRSAAAGQLGALARTLEAYRHIAAQDLNFTELVAETNRTFALQAQAAAANVLCPQPTTASAAAPSSTSQITAEVWSTSPTDNEWQSYFGLTKNEAKVRPGSDSAAPPTTAPGQKALDTILKCSRFGRPFGLGGLCNHWMPIGRLAALMRQVTHKTSPAEAEVWTSEAMLTVLLRSWEHATGASPFQVMYLKDATGNSTGSDYAYVRARQDLIRKPCLDGDGGPLSKDQHQQQQSQQADWHTDSWSGATWK
jgi:hypothetical protein